MPLFVKKKLGETPLEVVNKYRVDKEKTSFAGRLDPMARGEMIILKGNECKTQDNYCNLNKTYQFQILFGFSSDTYDIMGISKNNMKNYNINKIEKIEKIIAEFNQNLNRYFGQFEQYYPPYSSIIVKKQPLWWWSREGRINEVDIPFKNIKIYDLKLLGSLEINNLLDNILSKLDTLNPERREDFRIPKIIETWNTTLETYNLSTVIYEYEAKVSSGTYIRSLVNRIGDDLGMGALAFDINRINFMC